MVRPFLLSHYYDWFNCLLLFYYLLYVWFIPFFSRLDAAAKQRAEEGAEEEEEQERWELELSRRKERRGIDREVEIRLGDSCPDIRVSLVTREIVIGKMIHFKRNMAEPASAAAWADIVDQVAKAINVVEEVAAAQGVEPIHMKVRVCLSLHPTRPKSQVHSQMFCCLFCSRFVSCFFVVSSDRGTCRRVA